MENLKEKAFNSTIWSALERFGTQGLQFIIIVVLARILSPKDFGLIGMLAIFIALARVFVDSGLGTALIRKQNATSEDYSTVFIFNIITGFVIYLCLFFTSPYIADFYNEPKLVMLTRVISLNFLIGSFGSIHITILSKKLNFKIQTQISILSNLISGVIAIILAYWDYGVWALVIQSISYSFSSTIFYWLSNTWKPNLKFSTKSFRNLFGFSSKLLISILIDTIFQNIYLVIIGKWFNVFDLGYYTQAKKIQETPSLTINNIIQRVSFPVFSSIQHENERLKDGLKRTIKILVFVLFPVMLGLLAVSDSFVRIIFSEKWINSILYLKLLCIVGIFYPLQSINLNILNVKGRSDIFLRLEIIRKSLIILSIAIGFKWGIIGMVKANVIASAINYIIVGIIAGKLINYKIKEQIFDLIPYATISIIMVIAITMITANNNFNLQTLITQIIAGTIIYLGLSFLFKLEALSEILNLIKRTLAKDNK